LFILVSSTKFTMKSINIYNTKWIWHENIFHNECNETC
jgi:hypothetical protein